MKTVMMAAALVALLASPAFARSHQTTRDVDALAHASGAAAFAAVTPFGSPVQEPAGSPRASAIHTCSTDSAKYSQPTWADMNIHQYRSCMARYGQPE